jgi:hypothetical protein
MVDTVINLTEQQCMKSDPEYGQAVNCLREHKCTFEDVDLFNYRLIKSALNPLGIDMSEGDNGEAVAIITTNTLQEVLNAHKSEAACPTTQTLTVCVALDKDSQKLGLEQCSDLLCLNVGALKSMSPLPGHVTLFEGMLVVLRSCNLSTDLGITNGAQGIV